MGLCQKVVSLCVYCAGVPGTQLKWAKVSAVCAYSLYIYDPAFTNGVCRGQRVVGLPLSSRQAHSGVSVVAVGIRTALGGGPPGTDFCF